MKKLILLLILSSLLLGLVGFVQAEETKKPVADLIKQLGNDDFKTREAAQKELTELGEKLIDQYRQSKSSTVKDEITKLADALHDAKQNKDPEIRMRANQIRRHLYIRTQPKIAFTSHQSDKAGVYSADKSEIYVIDADGKNKRRLTKGYFPAWSPTGIKVVFTSWKGYIYVIDTNGKNKKQLTKERCLFPAWSPDGKKIAFVSEWDRIARLCIMDTDGKNQQELFKSDGGIQFIIWSPTNIKIAFVEVECAPSAPQRFGSDAMNTTIHIMDADGKNHVEVGKGGYCPVWSPDGTKIAYALYYGGKICVLDVDGENQKTLAEGYWPAWSPDGTKIAFMSRWDGSDEICVMDANGKNQKNLTKNQVRSSCPSWSPDGTKISFISSKLGYQEIYVVDTDGKNQRKLMQSSSLGTPVWSPWILKEISVLFADKEK